MDTLDLPGLLADLSRGHRVPGAQLAVHHDGRTASAEYGVETPGGRPVTAGTAFPLGSLTKPFTATLAAMLADDGDVGFGTPLAEPLPELGPVAADLTLDRLLSHTAGLAANAEDAERATTRRAWAAEHCRPAWPGIGPAFSYSNAGYVLTGHLIETVTGMTWWEAVEDLLLAPLEIVPAFVAGPRTARRAAAGHSVHPARDLVVAVAEEGDSPVEAPDGALALSAADLVALARLHLADPSLPALLGEDTLLRMREDRLAGVPIGPYGMADGWGLGWAIHRRDGVEWFGHDGTGEGTSCHLRFEPISGTVVALTTNANTGLAVWRDLVERLSAAGVEVGDHRPLADPGPPVPGPPGCAGAYANGAARFEVTADDAGGLTLRSTGPITCFPGLVFAVGEPPPHGRTAHVGRFLGDGGRIELIQVTGRLARRLPSES
ncbi:serine hydrolase domain-containing protein [Nonomuraea guangzhouensis]|uniref:Serine hydrolase domain-containing protein n=1 Tax=Nonomuraea guangzhouensis TaxID=1291555 RepID=A0ABW4GIF8_9ACTN|nr:serine hydrolase domain-containing protein [Nonomuraea guangzhouensis]